jgi:glycosyltransferase involved in cell wall biosynthesis
LDNLPLVSIIIPVYNSAAYIEDAVRSAVEQDYENKELIVVDDGSTDSTPDILKSFGDQIIVLSQKNAGPAAARNHGLRRATGTYVAFLDSDDYWVPEKLRRQIDYLEKRPDIGAVYSRWKRWLADEGGGFRLPPISPVSEPPAIAQGDSGWIYTHLLFDCRLLTSSVVLRKSIIDCIGKFDETLLRGQDYDYWLRLSRVTEIHKLDQELVLYRIHGDNIAVKYPDENYELMVVEKNVSLWGLTGPEGTQVPKMRLKRHLGELCFSFGYWHCQRGTFKAATAGFWKALQYHPGNWRAWIYLLLCGTQNLRGADRSAK